MKKATAKLNDVPETSSLSRAYLTRIVQSIVDAVPTEAVYIFGSYARGEEHKDSDIDIYVVTSSNKKKRWEYASDVGMSLMWMDKAKDILTAPIKLFDKQKTVLGSVEYAISTEGKAIYERSI